MQTTDEHRWPRMNTDAENDECSGNVHAEVALSGAGLSVFIRGHLCSSVVCFSPALLALAREQGAVDLFQPERRFLVVVDARTTPQHLERLPVRLAQNHLPLRSHRLLLQDDPEP